MPRFDKQCLHVGNGRPPDLHAAGDDVGGAPQAVGDPLVVNVDHRGGNGGAGVRGGDAGSHLTGPQNADAVDRPRFDIGIGDAPVAGEQILHEEDADERGRNRRSHDAERFLQFDLQTF